MANLISRRVAPYFTTIRPKCSTGVAPGNVSVTHALKNHMKWKEPVIGWCYKLSRGHQFPDKCCLRNVRKTRSNVERIVEKVISFLSSVTASVTWPARFIGRHWVDYFYHVLRNLYRHCRLRVVLCKFAFEWPYSAIGMRRFTSKSRLREFWCYRNTKKIFSIVSRRNVVGKSSCIKLQRKISRLFRLFSFQNRVNRTRP